MQIQENKVFSVFYFRWVVVCEALCVPWREEESFKYSSVRIAGLVLIFHIEPCFSVSFFSQHSLSNCYLDSFKWTVSRLIFRSPLPYFSNYIVKCQQINRIIFYRAKQTKYLGKKSRTTRMKVDYSSSNLLLFECRQIKTSIPVCTFESLIVCFSFKFICFPNLW